MCRLLQGRFAHLWRGNVLLRVQSCTVHDKPLNIDQLSYPRGYESVHFQFIMHLSPKTRNPLWSTFCMDPFYGVTGFVSRFPRVPLYSIRTFYWRVAVFSEVTSFRVVGGYQPFGGNWYFIIREEVSLLLQCMNAVVPVLLWDLSDLREQSAFIDP